MKEPVEIKENENTTGENKIKRNKKERGIIKVMQGLKELLTSEEQKLKKIKEVTDNRLVDVPDGTLRVTSSKNKVQYIQCVEDDNETGYRLSYIKKGDMALAFRLAQKSYDQKIQKLVDRRLKQLEKKPRNTKTTRSRKYMISYIRKDKHLLTL